MKHKTLSISTLKKDAKKYKKENPSIKHSQALDEVAKQYGFNNFKHFKDSKEQQEEK